MTSKWREEKEGEEREQIKKTLRGIIHIMVAYSYNR
jgi:hypothetical protein